MFLIYGQIFDSRNKYQKRFVQIYNSPNLLNQNRMNFSFIRNKRFKERQSKVARFRNQEIDILLTTTILERGVTFKHVQVIVIAADDPIYNTPSLVQIAGRVGRSADDRDGLVLFCYHKYTKNIRQAMKQIRMMNK